jgi:hypothetical protein
MYIGSAKKTVLEKKTAKKRVLEKKDLPFSDFNLYVDMKLEEMKKEILTKAVDTGLENIRIKKKKKGISLSKKSISEINQKIEKYKLLKKDKTVFSPYYPVTNFVLFQYNFKNSEELAVDFVKFDCEKKFILSLKKIYKDE